MDVKRRGVAAVRRGLAASERYLHVDSATRAGLPGQAAWTRFGTDSLGWGRIRAAHRRWGERDYHLAAEDMTSNHTYIK